MLKKLLVALPVALCCSAYAGNDQVPIDREIYRVKTYKGFAVVYFKPGFPNTQGCAHATQEQVILEFTDDGSTKEMYSSILAAAAAKKKVGFGISGCTSESLGYPTIYRVDVDY
ncbi:hypothetical protein [Microbulbifer sp. TRSA005]|uniref:hypothetical protein n=1 Tax=unclassified Microbulbifer TaxID=2619833 RepID=UPI0040396299